MERGCFPVGKAAVRGRCSGAGIAMSTAGFERGLMLRSPARFQEAAKRLVALYRKKRNDILDFPKRLLPLPKCLGTLANSLGCFPFDLKP